MQGEFKLDRSKDALKEALKKIFRIEKITVFCLRNNELVVDSSDRDSGLVVSEALKNEITKLVDSLEAGKPTDITKQSNKFPSLQPVLKKFNSNFCMKVKGERFEESYTLVYLFHFEFDSLKILFEK